jgi:hypothetical protein
MKKKLSKKARRVSFLAKVTFYSTENGTNNCNCINANSASSPRC